MLNVIFPRVCINSDGAKAFYSLYNIIRKTTLNPKQIKTVVNTG